MTRIGLYLLVAVISLACSRENSQNFSIRFRLEIPKDVTWGENISVNHLKFFIHDVQLLATDGNFHKAILPDLYPWQLNNTAFIKLDDSGETSRSKIDIQIQAPTERANDKYQGIRFVLGVPPEYNHVDPLQTESPFNVSSMFWSWQMGYKYFRFDLSYEQANFAFHVGSTGCKSPSSLRPPREPCTQPNLATITLMGFDPETHEINVNVHSILKNIYDDTKSTHCTGNYLKNSLCNSFIEQLGLSAETGLCVDECGKQNLFLTDKIH